MIIRRLVSSRSASEPHRPGQVEEGFRESPDWFASYPGHPPARILERDESPPPGFIDVEPTPSVPPDILGQVRHCDRERERERETNRQAEIERER